MATCNWCKRDMLKVNDCIGNREIDFPDGEVLPAIPYQHDHDQRCHDCNVAVGGYHHPGCDMERCPRCQGQLISCGCLDDGSDDDWGDDDNWCAEQPDEDEPVEVEVSDV